MLAKTAVFIALLPEGFVEGGLVESDPAHYALSANKFCYSNTTFQSRFMLTTVMPCSADRSSASTSGLSLNSRS